MNDSQNKVKASLESLLANSQAITGKQAIEKLRQRMIQAEEFAKAAHEEPSNQRTRI